MKPLGANEKKDLFFQYLVAFTIAAGALLAALFLTRDANRYTAGMDEQTQQLFNEFDRFEKSKPALEKLLDTVTAEANKIVAQNDEGSSDALITANGLINEFGKNQDDVNIANNLFADKVVELLRLYVNSKNEIKAKKDMQANLAQDLKECKDKLYQQNLIDGLQQNQNTQPAQH